MKSGYVREYQKRTERKKKQKKREINESSEASEKKSLAKLQKSVKSVVIATLNVEGKGIMKDKEFEINQLCVETGFHVLMLTEIKKIESEAKTQESLGYYR